MKIYILSLIIWVCLLSKNHNKNNKNYLNIKIK